MVDSGKIDNIIQNMKNKIKLTLYQFLLVFAGLILFNFASCAVEDVSSENTKVDSELIHAAKNFVEIEMHKNTNNAFLTSLPLTPDWEHAFVGKDKAIRVPMLSNDFSQDSFELFITKKSGKFAGKIIQFMPFAKTGKTGYHRILFSLEGKRETDLLIPKSYIMDLQNKMGYNSGIKSTGKTNNEDFPYLCSYFRDEDGNPAEFVALQFCPDGTLFNSLLEVCDWPSDAGINARKSFFKIVFSNDEVRNVSTYGFLEELEEVPVENNYHDPEYVPDDSSVWINFPPNFSYPSYPGGGNGEDYYPIGGLPTVTTKAQELKYELYLNNSQFNWIKGRPEIANSLFDYLFMNSFSTGAGIVVKNVIDQMMLNPNLTFSVESSLKSPFNIDRSSITNETSAGLKFNKVYDALLTSPEFEKMFINMFGNTARPNVIFKLGNVSNNANGTTTIDPLNPLNNTITIDVNFLNNNNKMLIAKTIIHEAIHAYLNVKLCDPNIGASIPDLNNSEVYDCINQYYNNFSEGQNQHNFIYNFMLPTMETILRQVKDLLVTPANNLTMLNDISVHIPLNTSPSAPFIWDDYYHNLALSGLQNCAFFQNEIGTIAIINGVPTVINTVDQTLMQTYNEYNRLGKQNINP